MHWMEEEEKKKMEKIKETDIENKPKEYSCLLLNLIVGEKEKLYNFTENSNFT